jgi:hypothetical protein
MQNMYDVFTAIRADEGDHVSAMEACLDPDVSLRSPSVERRVITGMAAVALASYFLAATGVVVDSGLMDAESLDAVATAASGDLTIVELIAATAAGWFQQLKEAESSQTLTEELIEGGAILTVLERFQQKIVEFLSRLF